MKRKISFFLTISTLIISLSACSQNKYDELESGLQYKFHRKGSDTKKPQINDILTTKMAYFIDDSLLFDSHQRGTPMQFPLALPHFKGDFYEGLGMMGEGDSASFLCPADSVFIHIFRVMDLPDFVTPASIMRFEIAMDKIQTEEEFQNAKIMETQALIEESHEKLVAFIAEQNITVEPTDSGLYFIELQKGNGKKPNVGQKVKVHYTGTLLEGVKFDSSHDRGEPIEFTLGVGQVIAGWDEGIALLEEGGKAKLIIPQHLAYRDRAAGIIPAYSPWIFEVELIEIVK